MTRNPTWLLERKKNVYSQCGEDGVIQAILETLPERDGWCVEFGAWDGVLASNSRNLIEHSGYSAVLIEASPRKFVDLQTNYAANKKVVPINAFVGFKTDDNLDALLKNHPVPKDFDLLSIDIDGNDYHVWKAMESYRPKAIVVEFNPTIPTEVRFVQPADPSVSRGASLLSLTELGREKGYELVSVVDQNAFFVDRKYFGLFEIADNRPETLRRDLGAITYLFSGYDGTVFLTGSKVLPWHSLPLNERKIQRLPVFLRKYPSNYNFAEKVAYAVVLGISSPRRLMTEIKRLWRKRFA